MRIGVFAEDIWQTGAEREAVGRRVVRLEIQGHVQALPAPNEFAIGEPMARVADSLKGQSDRPLSLLRHPGLRICNPGHGHQQGRERAQTHGAIQGESGAQGVADCAHQAIVIRGWFGEDQWKLLLGLLQVGTRHS